jgi:hypothetical protein
MTVRGRVARLDKRTELYGELLIGAVSAVLGIVKVMRVGRSLGLWA